MFIDRMLGQGYAPLLEKVVEFTARRQALLVENITNVDTPGYRQKDLSLGRFQRMVA